MTEHQNFTYTAIKDLNFISLSDVIAHQQVIQDTKSLNGNNWTFSNHNEHSIFEKMQSKTTPLSLYVGNHFFRGILTGYNPAFIIDKELQNQLISQDPKNEEIIKPFVIGDDIRHYQIHYGDVYVIFTRHGIDIDRYPLIKKYLEQFRESLEPRPKDWQGNEWKGRKPGKYQWYEIQDSVEFWTDFSKPKIVWPEIAKESRFAFDDNGYYLNKTCFFTPKKDFYLLSILNSKTIWFFLKNLCSVLGDADKGGRLLQQKIYIEQLPVRSISFTTTADHRTSLVNEVKDLYQSCTQSTDPQPLLAFIDTRLAAQPEESDVVHDLLAFLAEQMVEMNKAKNAEIKAFLNFVESEIGASVDTLSNKMLIQEYYANDFIKIVDVLVKNKSKIKVGYNPKSPTNRKNLEAWHTDSCGKLKPLMTKIDATDTLIDQIVYKLYGLTKEEIRIVEGQAK